MGDIQAKILSAGVWRHREIISQASGYTLTRRSRIFRNSAFDAVVGWGYKPTARTARDLAARLDLPYVAAEDGWLRSINPGSKELPRSLILDRSGIYYAADRPSDLEQLISASADCHDRERLARAEQAIALLRDNAISKYNNGPWLSERELGLEPRGARRRVLVIDQTFGDASVACGLADAASFERMIQAAVAENPDAEIVVKVHPEVVNGSKRGYLTGVDRGRFQIIDVAVNPWAMLDVVDKVYVVTSQLGFEAMLAGLDVVCFGAPFYSGWGLTDDRVAVPRRTARPSLQQVFAAAYFDYVVYIDPDTLGRVSFEETVARLVVDRAQMKQGAYSKPVQPAVAERPGSTVMCPLAVELADFV